MPTPFVAASEDRNPSHLLARAQALSSRIAAVNEIATAINRSLNVNEILRVVAKQAKWLMDFDHLSVYLDGDRQCEFITLFGPAIDFTPQQSEPSSSIQNAMQSGQPQFIRNDGSAFLPDYPASIVIPLENQRRIMGTINFASVLPERYTLDDVRIGYLLALQLAAAVGNAERFEELNQLYARLEREKQKSDELLLNTLPFEVAKELKQYGTVKPVHYQSASVLFADFKDFTHISSLLSPDELFDELNYCFSYFDQIIDKYNLEKLKTIGDCYMCVSGVPVPNETHAIDAVLAAIEMRFFVRSRRSQKLRNNQPYWDLRIGIHSGSLLAGVVGQKKFAYDVWGDTVNIASRVESSGISGQINVTEATLKLVQDFFEFEHRGTISIKNASDINTYLIRGIKPHLSLDPAGIILNQTFIEQYVTTHTMTSVPMFCQWANSLLPNPA